ncbi:hypothetical protein [Arenimonas sp.]|uniref:hypothetical protein n=1 Tax=Arenimonas sp. TaxID=1872635 RepID=UPI0035AEB05B
MNMHPSLYYFLPACALLFVFLPLTWMRVRAGMRPNGWTYLTWAFAAFMFCYSMVMGVIALRQAG